MTWGGPTGDHDEVTRVLPVERNVEQPAEGDDIVVIRRGPPPRSTVGRVVIAVFVAIVVLAAAVAVVALTNDDDSKNSVDASAPTPTSAPVTETTVAPRPTSPPARVPVSLPVQPTTPPTTAAPLRTPTTGAVPRPTAAAIVAPDVSLDPANATVSAGTPVVVTLRVHNGNSAATSVPYDDDGCDPALVPSPDTVCAQVARQLHVEAGADASTTITIATDNAAPGNYDVAIGDRSVRVTIV